MTTSNHPGDDQGTDHERMARALSAAAVAWWEVDLDTGAVSFDDRKATMLGYDPAAFDELADFTALLHEDDHERTTANLDAHLDGDAESYDVEYRMRAADGEYRWLRDVGGVSDVDDEGTPLRVSGVVLDVHAGRRRTECLQTRGEALALLNRIVRHDLRNDLNVITGWLELFATDPELVTRSRVDELVTVGERATELTENIREVVSMIESSGTVDTEPVRVGHVLLDEVERARAAYPEADVELASTVESSVVANPLLSSVFRNLLDNAVVHARCDDVHVHVAATETEDAVVVTVSDDGPGIPDGRKATLFTSEGSDVDRLEHGLGLYLVHSLVDAYGATIDVTDNDPVGTTVSVRLRKA